MAQTLEAIRGNGGSIKLGTTGTIGALMSFELESLKHTTQSQTRVFDRTLSTPRGFKSKTKTFSKCLTPEIAKKTKRHSRQSHVPILDSDNISIDGTPIRQKSDKRISYIVEVVDITCGSRDKAWVNPVTNRLKKLGFSKLSDNNIV